MWVTLLASVKPHIAHGPGKEWVPNHMLWIKWNCCPNRGCVLLHTCVMDTPSHLYSNVMGQDTSNKLGYRLPCSCTAGSLPLVHGPEKPEINITLDWFSVLGHENKRSVLTEGGGTLLTYPPFIFPAKTLLKMPQPCTGIECFGNTVWFDFLLKPI